MTPVRRVLAAAAAVELGTVVALFVNLATVHWAPVSSLLGPTHGCAYLLVVILTVRATRDARTRLLALVPAVGGLLVLRRLPESTTVDSRR